MFTQHGESDSQTNWVEAKTIVLDALDDVEKNDIVAERQNEKKIF